MWPLGVLKKEQVGSVGVLRLSLPFATNAIMIVRFKRCEITGSHKALRGV